MATLENYTQPTTQKIGPQKKVISGMQSDIFPKSLMDSQTGHYMTITAYGGGGLGERSKAVNTSIARGGPTNAQYMAAIYIPSGIGGSGIIYQTKNEYGDIKLTDVGGKVVSAFAKRFLGADISGMGEGLKNIAAFASKPINPGVEVLFQEYRTS